MKEKKGKKVKKVTKKKVIVKPTKVVNPKKSVRKVLKKVIKKQPKKLSKKAVVKKAAKPKVKKSAGYNGYTAAELAKFLELKKEYADYTNDKLKSILRANSQSMSGTKDQLIVKVADGEVLGAMPRCGKCGGGYLKWDNKTGKYWCKGYMDDTVWKFCHFSGGKDSVVRTPWVKS